jgi:MFS superfamily sulfate permease-like transporter
LIRELLLCYSLVGFMTAFALVLAAPAHRHKNIPHTALAASLAAAVWPLLLASLVINTLKRHHRGQR